MFLGTLISTTLMLILIALILKSVHFAIGAAVLVLIAAFSIYRTLKMPMPTDE